MIQCSSVSFGRLVCLNLVCKLVQGFMTIDRGSSPVLYCIASHTHTADTLLEAIFFGSRFIARIARGSPPLLLCASALFDKNLMPDMCRSALISYGPAVIICRVSIGSHGMPDGGSAISVGRIPIPWWY